MQNVKGKLLWVWVSVALVFLLVLFISIFSIQNVRSLFFGGPLSAATYSIGDTTLVDGISIRQGSDSVEIVRDQRGWTIQGKPADVKAVSNFLGAFQSVDIFSPIPRLVDSMLEARLRSNEAAVLTLQKHGKLFKQIRFLYTDTLGLGTVALASGGASGAVIRTNSGGTKLFYLLSSQPSSWINSKLFSIPLDKIREVTFTNHQYPDSSFTIQLQGDSCYVLNHAGQRLLDKIDRDAVSRYLIYLSRATMLSVASNLQSNMQPLYTINVIGSKENDTVDFIPLPPLTPIDEAGHKALFNYNQLMIRKNETNLYTANWVDVDLTVRTFQYFVKR
jgi:hypothetical protein